MFNKIKNNSKNLKALKEKNNSKNSDYDVSFEDLENFDDLDNLDDIDDIDDIKILSDQDNSQCEKFSLKIKLLRLRFSISIFFKSVFLTMGLFVIRIFDKIKSHKNVAKKISILAISVLSLLFITAISLRIYSSINDYQTILSGDNFDLQTITLSDDKVYLAVDLKNIIKEISASNWVKSNDSDSFKTPMASLKIVADSKPLTMNFNYKNNFIYLKIIDNEKETIYKTDIETKSVLTKAFAAAKNSTTKILEQCQVLNEAHLQHSLKNMNALDFYKINSSYKSSYLYCNNYSDYSAKTVLFPKTNLSEGNIFTPTNVEEILKNTEKVLGFRPKISNYETNDYTIDSTGSLINLKKECEKIDHKIDLLKSQYTITFNEDKFTFHFDYLNNLSDTSFNVTYSNNIADIPCEYDSSYFNRSSNLYFICDISTPEISINSDDEIFEKYNFNKDKISDFKMGYLSNAENENFSDLFKSVTLYKRNIIFGKYYLHTNVIEENKIYVFDITTGNIVKEISITSTLSCVYSTVTKSSLISPTISFFDGKDIVTYNDSFDEIGRYSLPQNVLSKILYDTNLEISPNGNIVKIQNYGDSVIIYSKDNNVTRTIPLTYGENNTYDNCDQQVEIDLDGNYYVVIEKDDSNYNSISNSYNDSQSPTEYKYNVKVYLIKDNKMLYNYSLISNSDYINCYFKGDNCYNIVRNDTDSMIIYLDIHNLSTNKEKNVAIIGTDSNAKAYSYPSQVLFDDNGIYMLINNNFPDSQKLSSQYTFKFIPYSDLEKGEINNAVDIFKKMNLWAEVDVDNYKSIFISPLANNVFTCVIIGENNGYDSEIFSSFSFKYNP